VKILTLGFYDKFNFGDETYKDTFKSLFPSHEFTFVNQLNQNLIDSHDIVLLGGGNVLRNHYINELKKVKNKKIYAYSVGMEDNCTESLDMFSHIYARDFETLDKLKAKNVSASFIPDAALCLSGNPENGKKIIERIFKEEDLDLYSKTVVIVVNSYMAGLGNDSLARDAFNFIKFSYDLAKTVDETPASFIFVPFGIKQPHDDRTTNSWVASKCKFWKKNYVMFNQLNYKEVLDIISYSNLVISSRLHSTIFSYITGTPFIDITHHSKNEIFVKMIEKNNNSISYWNFDNTILKNKIKELLVLPKNKDFIKLQTILKEKTNEIYFDR